jgi:nucleoside-diphosphate-sugar epimerase
VKRICVTGGAGFLGSHIVRELKQRGYDEVFIPRSEKYDLRKTGAVKRMYKDSHADVIIHLAARVGGIGANRLHPGKFFYDNAKMGIEVIEQGRKYSIEKIVIVGTICSYPKYTPIPFREEDLWNGYPEETNAPYGLAKKMLLVQAQAYRQEYGLNSIYLMPVNLYGPRDDFSPQTSHVIPAIIRKCLQAKSNGKQAMTAWGTGNPTREFLYVEDAARGIVDGMERYDIAAPMNLGSGNEITIRELVETIKNIVGYQGKVEWDLAKPDGQPRRCVDATRAKQLLSWEPKIGLKDGLHKTVHWYKSYLASCGSG